MMRSHQVPAVLITGIVLGLGSGGAAVAAPLTPIEQLGKALFFDKNLSRERNQSCASCHEASVGWTGADEEINRHGAVYEGSVRRRFGRRKSPSVAYSTQALPLGPDPEEKGSFLGGHFWDGHATGALLGHPAADQALVPFLDPLEQALPSVAELVGRVATAPYAPLFRQVLGAEALADTERAYRQIGRAIAAFEGSREVNRFSSKYDAVLAGKAKLTPEERRGLELFGGKAKCANCHPSQPGPHGEPPLFTDFTYDNLGVPRNADHPYYAERDVNPLGAAWADLGLGGYLATTEQGRPYARQNLGKFKVPTLRNVDLRPTPRTVKAYMHNGCFKSLEEVVHFYNTRDVLPACTGENDRPGMSCWPLPEVGMNVNTDELGNLGLTADEEAAVVAFLRTLSDGWVAPVRR
ncbi:MAG TPA: cytochrome c peroxidase [Polyangia bacterium]|nr:cytochrome c peroxidase [Polyangia bacterium]